jgi:hypothetical protein
MVKYQLSNERGGFFMEKNKRPKYNVWQNTLYVLRGIWEFDRSLFFLLALEVIFGGIQPLPLLLLPKYVLDEVSDGKDTLEFRGDGETVLTIRINEDSYDFFIGEECIHVADLNTLEAAKQMIMLKKAPNRKPFPKEGAVYGECGHRCDLCVHYAGGTAGEGFRKKLHEHICRVYGWNPNDEIPPCNGCVNGGLDKKFNCEQRN